MRRATCLALALVAFVVAVACGPPASKWETWRLANVVYEWKADCPGGGVGYWDQVRQVACLDRDQIDGTVRVSLEVGRPAIAKAVLAYVINHEAAHKMDFALGQPVATYECSPYGPNCPFNIRGRAWERGAECILQLVRPDLDIVRAFWFANDGYWRCPKNWLDFYRPRLRFAGVL